MRKLFSSILMLGLMMGAVPVFAQSNETRVLVDRLNQLENQVQILSRQSFSDSDRPQALAPSPSYKSPDSAAISGLEVRLSSLEEQLRQLNGQIEKQNFDITQLKTRLDKMQGDMEMRLNQLEQNKTPAESPASNALPESQSPPPAPSSDADINDPSRFYDQAYAKLQAHDYAGAESDFRAFLKKYPDHNLSSNAQYWLGETLYARGKYKEAVTIFAEAYQKYPKGNKAPDTLLKLGLSLSQVRKNTEACTVFRQLSKDFPNASSSVTARAEVEMKRLKCK